MYLIQTIIGWCLIVLSLAGDNNVPYITKCAWDDTNCLVASTNAVIPKFADGIPEANIEKMDPISLDSVDASSPNLNFVVDNIKIVGIKNCIAEKVERNLKKSKLYLSLLCSLNFTSNYKINGKLLTLVIEGHDKLEAALRKLAVNLEVDLEEYEKKSKKYWRIKKWDYNFDLKDKSDINFGKLAGTSEVIVKALKELLSTNGNTIILEICPPIVKAVINKMVNNVAKFFKYASLSDLIIN